MKQIQCFHQSTTYKRGNGTTPLDRRGVENENTSREFLIPVIQLFISHLSTAADLKRGQNGSRVKPHLQSTVHQ